jgi:O-antigen chain-terminating methyltransferase
LRYSREGKGVKVRINGLLLRFIFHAFCRLPVVGPFAAWVKCWLKLPTAIRTIQRNEGAAVAGFSDLGRHMDNLAASLEDQLSMLQNLQSEIMDKRLAVVRQILEMHGRQNEGMEHQIADMKNGLDEQHKQTLSIQKHQEESIEPEIAEILIKIREHENHINDHRQHLSVLLTGDGHVLDAMYASFEDQFRGTRDEIKRRLSVYLPFIEPFKTATGRAQFLDVGCGRGEWLELLKENGYSATGVDLNSVMVQQCRDLGFDTVECDAIEYLGSQELNSLAAITAFHFIEHLPFNALIAFLDSALKSLKPGGIFIIETPNPQNILVGSCNFYLDPTHIKPLPAAAMKFIVETRGFDEVQILPLNPYPETFFLSGSELAERFNKLFYGPQDYAVMGRKKP